MKKWIETKNQKDVWYDGSQRNRKNIFLYLFLKSTTPLRNSLTFVFLVFARAGQKFQVNVGTARKKLVGERGPKKSILSGELLPNQRDRGQARADKRLLILMLQVLIPISMLRSRRLSSTLSSPIKEYTLSSDRNMGHLKDEQPYQNIPPPSHPIP